MQVTEISGKTQGKKTPARKRRTLTMRVTAGQGHFDQLRLSSGVAASCRRLIP